MQNIHRPISALLRRAVLLLTALGCLTGPSTARGAGNVATYVLLVTDTSDWMNRVPPGDSLPSCIFPQQKSRWISVQEALGGTLNNYDCKIKAVNLPGAPGTNRVVIQDAATFGVNGLLLQNGNEVRFGLMTADTIRSTQVDSTGGYSFGPDVAAGQGLLNLGGRNSVAAFGQLIAFNTFGNLTTEQHNTELVKLIRLFKENEAKTIIPYGQDISLAALLSDAVWFFDRDPSVVSGPGGDPFAACRKKVVFLITSGKSVAEFDDQVSGKADGPYQGAHSQVAALLSYQGIRTYVFYFDAGDPAVDERMNALAIEGGTGMAFKVIDGNTLRLAMSQAVNVLLEGTYSETRTATTYDTYTQDLPLNQKVAQIQVMASYSLPPVGRPYGHLDVISYLCNQERPQTAYDFGTLYNGVDPKDRRIVTPTPNKLKALAYHSNNSSLGLTPARLEVPDAAKAEKLVNFLKGTDSPPYIRGPHKLAAIRNSSPQIVGPPSYFLPFPSYMGALNNGKISFKERHKERPTVVYFGTDDGLLHAVQLVSAAKPEHGQDAVGKELFSYLPGPLQPRIKELEGGDPSLLDGTPIIRDVRLRNQAQPEDEQWVTALVGGGRKGGRFYYAINVSDPLELGKQAPPETDAAGLPLLLWEMDAKNRPNPDPGLVQERLGLAYGRPAIGHVVVSENGNPAEIAVAFLSGGKQDPTVGAPNRTGLAFWVVALAPQNDPNRGLPRILRTFVDTQATVDPMPYPIVGTPVVHGTIPGQPTTRGFVTDAGGRLWRLDLTSQDPAAWTMRVMYDPYLNNNAKRRPAYFEPSLAFDENGRLVVIYGTGDPDNPADDRDSHVIVSLPDAIQVMDNGPVRPYWKLTLQPGEHLSASTLIFDSVVYFPTYLHSGLNACGTGESRLWGVHFTQDLDPAKEKPNILNDVNPRFPTNKAAGEIPDCDEEPTKQGQDYKNRTSYCRMPDGVRIVGLEITSSNNCIDYDGDWLANNNPGNGLGQQAGPGAPKLSISMARYLPIGLLGAPLKGQLSHSRLLRSLSQQAGRGRLMPLMWGIVNDE